MTVIAIIEEMADCNCNCSGTNNIGKSHTCITHEFDFFFFSFFLSCARWHNTLFCFLSISKREKLLQTSFHLFFPFLFYCFFPLPLLHPRRVCWCVLVGCSFVLMCHTYPYLIKSFPCPLTSSLRPLHLQNDLEKWWSQCRNCILHSLLIVDVCARDSYFFPHPVSCV